MRLVFSSTDYLNAELSDEQGHKIYTLSTPRANKEVTAITKHASGTGNDTDQVISVIEWHKTRATMIQINGQAVAADTLLVRQQWSSSRHFTGPDGRPYKWKLENSYCWLKPRYTNIQLARFHKRNIGLMNPAHPPYLEIATSVAHMMDYIITTFAYVEHLRQERQRRQMATQSLTSHTHHMMMHSQTNQMMMQNQLNQMTVQNQMTTMSSAPASGPSFSGC